MAVCVAVYLMMLLMPDEVGQHFAYMYGMVPIRYSNPDWAYAFGLPPDHYLSFLTSLFLHGGFLHLLMNMVFLWIFADNIEDLMGHRRFTVFYILCGCLRPTPNGTFIRPWRCRWSARPAQLPVSWGPISCVFLTRR